MVMLLILDILIKLTALRKVRWEKVNENKYRLNLDCCRFTLTRNLNSDLRLWVWLSDGDFGSFEEELHSDKITWYKMNDLWEFISGNFSSIVLELVKIK